PASRRKPVLEGEEIEEVERSGAIEVRARIPGSEQILERKKIKEVQRAAEVDIGRALRWCDAQRRPALVVAARQIGNLEAERACRADAKPLCGRGGVRRLGGGPHAAGNLSQDHHLCLVGHLVLVLPAALAPT